MAIALGATTFASSAAADRVRTRYQERCLAHRVTSREMTNTD